jgi:hypothetical protein
MTKTSSILLATISCLSLTVGCLEGEPASEEPTPELAATDEVSDCGGFPELRPPVPHDGPIPGYCDAERLLWTYDADTAVLDLTNTRIELNCCGVHGMDIELVDGVYVVTEQDDPEPGGGRCDCICVYDFALTTSGVPADVIELRLERLVTDSGPSRVVWEGVIDLGEGEGEIEVSDEPSMWCDTL